MDALKLYGRVCAECSVLTTKAYSSSFSGDSLLRQTTQSTDLFDLRLRSLR